MTNMMQGVTLLTAIVVGVGFAQKPTLRINSSGLTVLNFHSDLPRINMSCLDPSYGSISLDYCFSGLWLHYQEENYVWGARLMQPSTCSRIESRFPKSFRVVGHPGNYTAPSFTVFTDTSFRGDVFRVLGDMANFQYAFSSFYLVMLPIKLYTEPNFGGETTCIVAGRPGPGQPIKYTASSNITVDYGLDIGQIRSIQFTDTCS